MERKEFGPVVNWFAINEKIPCSIQLWGNRGLFAGTRIFWNRSHGIWAKPRVPCDLSHIESRYRTLLLHIWALLPHPDYCYITLPGLT
jgi:hypothetical protein